MTLAVVILVGVSSQPGRRLDNGVVPCAADGKDAGVRGLHPCAMEGVSTNRVASSTAPSKPGRSLSEAKVPCAADGKDTRVRGLHPCVFEGLSTNRVDSSTAMMLPRQWAKAPARSVFSCTLRHRGRQPLVDLHLIAEPTPHETEVTSFYDKVFAPVKGAVAPFHDVVLLHRLVHFYLGTGPLITLETGFGHGSTTVGILAALGVQATHIVIDPWQNVFRWSALKKVKQYLLRSHHHSSSGVSPHLIHVNETAGTGLSRLVREHVCVDMALMDDGHKVDDNMLELYYITQLLRVGGMLVMHDAPMPSVQKAIRFATTSLGYKKLTVPTSPPFEHPGVMSPGGVVLEKGYLCQVLVKTKEVDEREWNHFVDF